MGLSEVLKKIEMGIGVACLGAMFVVICLNVFMRYVMNAPIFWAEEVSNFLFVWAGFLSCAHVLADDRHIRVTLLVGTLPARARHWLELAMAAILVAMFGSFVSPSLTALQSLNVTAALQIPEYIPYAILPIAMTLCCVHSVFRIFRILSAIVAGGRESVS